MTRKEQFLAFVFFDALAEDLRSDTAHAQVIAQMASEIPEEKIPHCPANAARVFLAYSADGRSGHSSGCCREDEAVSSGIGMTTDRFLWQY